MRVRALLNELLLICLGLVVHVNRRCCMWYGNSSLLRILRHLGMRARQGAVISSVLSYLWKTLIISHHCSMASRIDRVVLNVSSLGTILVIVYSNSFEFSVISIRHHYALWVGRLRHKFLICRCTCLRFCLNNASSCVTHVSVNSRGTQLCLLVWF